ncbi:DUF29 domain-containing protein [Duganella radicis]|uniref:DUF29 family protein n=1 Tax=Duganella radicis TaxID=551988 RepID=A0A6L6PKU9_9BURK|nr:DUF29 domain-containing protein [Duganella radicis]MTV39251.1 DUF29 family protein [Duganella radicis]
MDDHFNNLYQADFHRWLLHQAELLQAHDFERLDLPNLIEEIETMGKNRQHELEHRLTILIMHLLKFQLQPDHIGRSWISTIFEQRERIKEGMKRMPSLRPKLEHTIQDAYKSARRKAARETGIPIENFPRTVPFTMRQILDSNFLP